jgi:hypothetical protein
VIISVHDSYLRLSPQPANLSYDRAVTKKPNRDEWMRDVAASQRNIVFPDTVANEARFWRNLGSRPLTAVQKVGLGLLALFAYGFLIFLTLSIGGLHTSFRYRLEAGAEFLLTIFVIFAPLMACLAWATKRALRQSRRESGRNAGR